MKNKLTTIGIIIATIILAGVAVFTAVRLYQLRQESITPVQPTSKPKAGVVCPQPGACTSLFFRLGATPTPSATPKPAPGCNSVCRSNADCLSFSSPVNSTLALICYFPPSSPTPRAGVNSTAPTGFCREATCPTAPDCFCGRAATPSPTPRFGTTPTPTSTPTTPPGATDTPTPVPGATATPVPGATTTPIPGAGTTPEQPALPNAGVSFPTILGISLGSLLLIGALILAL